MHLTVMFQDKMCLCLESKPRRKLRRPYKYNIYLYTINDQRDELKRFSHFLSACLPVRLYTYEIVPQFLEYRFEILHTFFRPQETARLTERQISNHYSI